MVLLVIWFLLPFLLLGKQFSSAPMPPVIPRSFTSTLKPYLQISRSNSNSNNPTITLEWDSVMGAVGYNVYYGPSPHVYTNLVNAATNHVTVPALVLTPRWYAVTAYNEFGVESDFSPELVGANLQGDGFEWKVPPGRYDVQMSTNLISWQTIQPPFTLDQTKAFYRLKTQ